MSVKIAVIDNDGIMRVWERGSCEITRGDDGEMGIRFDRPLPYTEVKPKADLKFKLEALGLTEISEAEGFDFERMYAATGPRNPVEYALRNTFGLTVRHPELPNWPGAMIYSKTLMNYVIRDADGRWWDGGRFVSTEEIGRWEESTK